MGKMGSLEKLFVNSPGHSRRVAEHAAKMLEWVELEPGQKYLDLGCGNGMAPIHVGRRFGLAVTGVDVDSAQIRQARESAKDLQGARFVTVDGTHLPFQDGEFHIVATNKVTHHIPQWEDALEEMIRVSRPGGFFIYNDIVYPRLVAAVGRMVAGKRAGFPTTRELEAFVDRNRLSKLHLSRSPVHYEAVCRLPVTMQTPG